MSRHDDGAKRARLSKSFGYEVPITGSAEAAAAAAAVCVYVACNLHTRLSNGRDNHLQISPFHRDKRALKALNPSLPPCPREPGIPPSLALSTTRICTTKCTDGFTNDDSVITIFTAMPMPVWVFRRYCSIFRGGSELQIAP